MKTSEEILRYIESQRIERLEVLNKLNHLEEMDSAKKHLSGLTLDEMANDYKRLMDEEKLLKKLIAHIQAEA